VIPSLLLFFLAAVPVLWKDWLYARPISVNSAGLATFICPRALYDHAGSKLADLRLLNGEGSEVPFALQKRPPHGVLAWRPAKFLKDPPDQAATMEVILDTGEQNRLHNALLLDIPETDFLAHVELSASDVPDHDWHLLRSDSPIYRYRPDGLEGNQTVTYAENYSRYLKVKLVTAPTERVRSTSTATIGKPIHLLRCQVAYDDTSQPEWSDFSPVFLNEASSTEMQSWFRADAQIDSLPVTGIRVTTTSRDFHRALRVSSSNDAKNWTELGTGDIYRTAGEEPAEKLVVEVPESSGRYWRVMFYDNGEPPLTIERIVLLGVPYHVVFQAQPNTLYHLLYGNGKVAAAQYDLGRVLPANAFQTAAKASVGEEELNTVTGRGWKFWSLVIGGGALVVLVVVVLLFAVASEG
jgi:hypothetical protein